MYTNNICPSKKHLHPFVQSSPSAKTEHLIEKHQAGETLTGKERGLISRAIGEAKRSGDEEQAQQLQAILREQGKREKQTQGDPEIDWLHRKNPDLHTSRDVRLANRLHRRETAEKKEKRQQQAVEVFIKMLEKTITEKDKAKTRKRTRCPQKTTTSTPHHQSRRHTRVLPRESTGASAERRVRRCKSDRGTASGIGGGH